MSEFRKDPVLNNWTIIAPEKKTNYEILKDRFIKNIPEKDEKCPFCNLNPEEFKVLLKYNFVNKENWDIIVIPAPNPYLKVETELKKEAEGIYDLTSGTGANEIIIESPEHNEHIEKMSINRIEQIFWAYHDRIVDLRNDKRLEYLLFFKEFAQFETGQNIHPHSKMIATPFIPPLIEKEMVEAEDYFSYKDRCVFCDVVKQEMKEGKRVVSVNPDFIAFCPYASRFPFEIWIMPVTHISHFENSPKIVFYHLAEIYNEVFKKIKKVLGNIPYQTVLHNAPLQEESLEFYHWHIEIYPTLECQSAINNGSEMFVNPVVPEVAAEALRTGNIR